jgi:hypothetical protein
LTPLYDQEVKHIDNFNIEFTYQPIFWIVKAFDVKIALEFSSAFLEEFGP